EVAEIRRNVPPGERPDRRVVVPAADRLRGEHDERSSDERRGSRPEPVSGWQAHGSTVADTPYRAASPPTTRRLVRRARSRAHRRHVRHGPAVWNGKTGN